ncbi:MAG: hydantoinase B/oxoprolinase family protein [Gammaproteobacteria bacterium]|nr:hydantoinase B/oxoprolinase family protein [Gammaproteobacteria bacterium]
MDTPVRAGTTLDPVTFEVLRNALVNIVDQMAEQVRRTCFSFVVYNRDFSNALCDADGNTVAQGNQDLAAHVGTLHYTCKAVLEEFRGEIHPGDVFLINDPYVGGTHFSDTRVLLPIFVQDELIAWAQANGHWADMGGSVPGSFDVTARDMFKEGIRIPPVKIWRRGEFCADVAKLIAKNTRDPAAILGDMEAQTQATRIAERELLRLCTKYGVATVKTAFAEVQDYVERAVRLRLSELPDGSWETVDFIDQDPSESEGLIPIRVKMTIRGDSIEFDLSGSHPTIGTIYNCAFGATFAAIVSGMKTFFPDVPLNAGLYRTIKVIAPDDTVISARWPVAVSGFVMGFEKIMNAIFELFSQVMPERAMACAFNIEYLQTGGFDARGEKRTFFMLYDWLSGGWGGRNGKDGLGVTASCFGVGLMTQPVEGQERMCPVRTDRMEIVIDSGGPGEFRGGVGLDKGGTLLEVERCVFSYFCDRERSIVWGINGGLPARPHGLWLERPGEEARFLGAMFSDVPVTSGTKFWRGTSGGGGYGDPLKRDPRRVLEDVVDDYVSLERARQDYGVVLELVDEDLAEYTINAQATRETRAYIATNRKRWLDEDPATVSARFRARELDLYDVIRRYGVICDWGTGHLLPATTRDFRAMMQKRCVPYWT